MRIALVNPTYWPEVRRGAERLVHDLAASLARDGHDVTLLTTHRARSTTTQEEGFRVVRSYRLPDRPFHARSYNYHLHVAPTVAWQLARGRLRRGSCLPAGCRMGRRRGAAVRGASGGGLPARGTH